MPIRFRGRNTALAVFSVAVATCCGVASADASPTATLFVNNGAVSGDSGHSCQTAAYSTIGAAVAVAAPGSCGEAIHLVAVTNSLVARNTVENNAGGILMTDEFGPSSGNVIRGNRSLNNTDDCGITVAGHSAAIDPGSGVPTGLAGIFDNVIEGNVSIGNGVAGQGAGISAHAEHTIMVAAGGAVVLTAAG